MRHCSIPLSEVSKWGLEDVDKMNALLDMEQDMSDAQAGYFDKMRNKD